MAPADPAGAVIVATFEPAPAPAVVPLVSEVVLGIPDVVPTDGEGVPDAGAGVDDDVVVVDVVVEPAVVDVALGDPPAVVVVDGPVVRAVVDVVDDDVCDGVGSAPTTVLMKTTSTDATLPGWTWSSATNPDERFHGNRPPGSDVPASCVT